MMEGWTPLIAGGLVGLAMVSVALLRGWSLWLTLKMRELELIGTARGASSPSTTSRIEVADLKERIRKLEAIAAGVDL